MRLVDGHVWAKRYDGSIQDVFALQDQVSAQIVSALAMNLTTQEVARIEHVQTDVTQAYDLFLRGMQHYMKATPDHYAEAMKFFQQALDVYSGRILPLIPFESCHPFHFKAATDSGESCHP